MSWDAYTQALARIQLPDGWVQVTPAAPGRATGPFPDANGHPVHIITAHNPHGQNAPAAANADAQSRLRQLVEAEGYAVLEAAGGDRSWTHVEASIAILAMPEARARALGQQFGQDAVFAWTPTEWTVLSCGDQRRTVQGWSAEPLRPPPSGRAQPQAASREQPRHGTALEPGGVPAPPRPCPTCGADLTQQGHRDRLTLADVEDRVRDLHGGDLKRLAPSEDDLLAWRCRACSALIAAHPLTSPLRHLATSLFFTPAPSGQGHLKVALVTPSMYLGTPPFIPSTAVTTAQEVVAVVLAGGTAALPDDGDEIARQALRELGLCEHRVEDRLRYTRTAQLGPPCDCERPPSRR